MKSGHFLYLVIVQDQFLQFFQVLIVFDCLDTVVG